MGKRLPSATNLHPYTRFAAERIIKTARLAAAARTPPKLLASTKQASPSSARAAPKRMEADQQQQQVGRLPLSEAVSDCVRRWFQDTLKEARAGDTAMQVLVGQMYHTGYGVARNEQKAKAWFTKASRYRSSVWKVNEKHPGYNASDSDSDEVKDEMQ